MTLRAVTPEFAVVAVFLGVTAVAIRGDSRIFGRAVVTAGTGQIGVRTGQRKMGFLGVVKFPVIPATGVVALAAGLAEPTFMFVVTFMAVETGQRRIFIRSSEMATRAVNGRVQAQQRKLGERVVESHLLRPAPGVVATLALIALLTFVNIVCAMTADTGHRQFHGFDIAAVAAVAGQICVLAL